MKPKLVALALLFAAWLPAACVAAWIWPLLAVPALVAGWFLARWSAAAFRYAYPLALGPSLLTASMVVGYALARPDPHFGAILGVMAALQFICALAAFAFVRHVLQPAGQ